ncbi:MAG: sulfite exporter TauE/SafE family protein [Ilumatobacteraceae bacterium]
MSGGELIVVAVAVLAASFVQIIAGFGFALLCMPIMTLAIDVKAAVVVSTLVATVSISWQAWVLRGDAAPNNTARLCIGAFLGMPRGLVVLHGAPEHGLRLALGIAVLIATALLAMGINLSHAGAPLDIVAGFLSGVLNTSLSTNGPPLVFALQARQLDADQFRGTLVRVFAFSNIVTITMFATTGTVTGQGLRAAAVALPAWLVGTLAGWPVRSRISGEPFRRMVLALLCVVGVSAVYFALTSG